LWGFIWGLAAIVLNVSGSFIQHLALAVFENLTLEFYL
jgi:hypothetical protein